MHVTFDPGAFVHIASSLPCNVEGDCSQVCRMMKGCMKLKYLQ